MFYTIHRAVKLLLLSVAIFLAWKIYTRREIFEPALIWFQVWENGGFHVPKPETTSAKVIQVVNSQTFVMSPRPGARINVRLMGLREPSRDVTPESVARENKRKEALEELVLGRRAHVEALYQSANNLGGIVFVGGTNVNAELVLRGLASTSKQLVKGLPKEDQYALLWAQRHRPD